MRQLLVIAVVGCTDYQIEITSPRDGDLVPITGPVVMTVNGDGFGARPMISFTVGEFDPLTEDTLQDDCDPCEFTLTFTPSATPGTKKIFLGMEYDNTPIASDEVTVTFVAPAQRP